MYRCCTLRLNWNMQIQPSRFIFRRCFDRKLESIILFWVFKRYIKFPTVSGQIWDFYWNQKDADCNLKPGGVSGASRSLIWGPFMKKLNWTSLLSYVVSIGIKNYPIYIIYIYIYILYIQAYCKHRNHPIGSISWIRHNILYDNPNILYKT